MLAEGLCSLQQVCFMICLHSHMKETLRSCWGQPCSLASHQHLSCFSPTRAHTQTELCVAPRLADVRSRTVHCSSTELECSLSILSYDFLTLTFCFWFYSYALEVFFLWQKMEFYFSMFMIVNNSLLEIISSWSGSLQIVFTEQIALIEHGCNVLFFVYKAACRAGCHWGNFYLLFH